MGLKEQALNKTWSLKFLPKFLSTTPGERCLLYEDGPRCCLGCRVCGCWCSVARDWFVASLWLSFPSQEGDLQEGAAAALPLEVGGRTPLSRCVWGCLPAAAQAAGTLTTVFQSVVGLRGLGLLRKHEGNTNSWHHTYISGNLSALLSKQKISTSQECEAAKCEAWCSHLHISPRRLFQPQLFWVCCFGQNKKKVDVPFHFSSSV